MTTYRGKAVGEAAQSVAIIRTLAGETLMSGAAMMYVSGDGSELTVTHAGLPGVKITFRLTKRIRVVDISEGLRSGTVAPEQ